jgi:hypothetical protein
MGLIEEKIKEIESEKTDFLHELEGRISRLRKEGHIGLPNHMHFGVNGDVRFKYLMTRILNSRGLPIYIDGKKLGSKFIAECSQKAYEEVIVYTLDELGPIVYDKYQAISDKFWDSMYEMFFKSK